TSWLSPCLTKRPSAPCVFTSASSGGGPGVAENAERISRVAFFGDGDEALGGGQRRRQTGSFNRKKGSGGPTVRTEEKVV
ncbi:hypothetical protein NQ318_019314, partial [Aromia moschata]